MNFKKKKHEASSSMNHMHANGGKYSKDLCAKFGETGSAKFGETGSDHERITNTKKLVIALPINLLYSSWTIRKMRPLFIKGSLYRSVLVFFLRSRHNLNP